MRQRVWSGLILCGLLGCSHAAVKEEPAPTSGPEAPATSSAPPEGTAPEEAKAPEGEDLPLPRPVVVTASPQAKDRYMLQSQRVEGSTLTLEVSYGGGCRQHDFELAWNGAFEKGASGAPLARLVLVHDGHNDHCKAIRFETLRFDVSPLATVGTVDLVLDGSDEVLRYTP